MALIFFGAAIIGRYAGYFDDINFNFGLMLILKLLLFIVTAMLLKNEQYNDADENGYSVESYSFVTTRIYYFIGILITLLGYMFAYMDRVGIYFYLFETIYVGMLIKSKRIALLLKLFVMALYVALCALAVFGNGQGQGEYLFCWQQ